MKIGDRYQNSDDANQQLHNTLVELDGELCHIERVEGWTFQIRKVVEANKQRRWAKKIELKHIKDMDLNLQQFPLGYVNCGDNSYYLKRKPLRKWKQGFYHEYMQLVYNEEKHNPQLAGLKKAAPLPGGSFVSKLFHGQSMVDLYDNNYPTFARAFVMVSLMNKRSVAWHRHWAFSRTDVIKNRMRANEFNLLYKGKIVGRVQKGDVFLKHEFRYLTEPFVEAMIHAS